MLTHRRYPEVYLEDFKGERSYYTPALHNRGEEQRMALGDIRQILTEYCVLPLLSNQLHESTQHIKSLIVAGSKGSGKDMLVHAVCTESGAVLFDLTPANIVGKYPGKSGLVMLLHLVTKVARLLQPSVIYMDNAERPFVKKIPKTDKTDPKRLKKDLPKMVKSNFFSMYTLSDYEHQIKVISAQFNNELISGEGCLCWLNAAFY